ncbi:hypothetical protein DRP43_05100 [candidate division TA06 bacterium]|uniref:DegV family protein n=1 Tax=candidate division TA06 bacterium TaxID=2250710 RepID=A0A660SFL1_UNCT6|nr:MAG: hypothetical protein DRP43_05100 [candidate division TA06 bacterium]
MVRIFVDDGGYISEETIKKYNIVVLKHPVFIKEKEVSGMGYKQFCDKLKGGVISRTALISPAYIQETYEGIEENDIISVHISSGMSGTINSARKASESVKGKNIHIVDSLMTCSGEALLAMILAYKANEGATFEGLRNEADKIRDNIKYYLVIEDLSYLERGGRIGKAKALLSSLFKIKPILAYNNEGKIIPYNKVRTNMQVIGKIFNEDKKYKYILVNKTYYSDLQDNVIEKIKDRCENLFVAGSNNVITNYLGPIAWTIAMY